MKLEIKGEIVSQDRSRRRIHLEKRKHFAVTFSKKQTYKAYGQHTFHAVAKEGDEAGFGAERSHHIGGACVAAAVIADIDAVGLSVNIAGLKETEEITDGQTADSNPHTHLSFSSLSRIMNFREVPWKPKVSRILFSR